MKSIKKLINKWTIAMSICLISILSLFAFTKTYAYDLDNNNNLVGNNIDSLFVNSSVNTTYSTNNQNITYSKIDNNTLRVYFNSYNGDVFKCIFNFPEMNNLYGSSKVTFVVLLDTTHIQTTSSRFWVYGLCASSTYFNNNFIFSSNTINCNNYGTYAVANCLALNNYSGNLGVKISFGANTGIFDGYFDIKCLAFEDYNINYVFNNNSTFYPYSSIEQLQQDYNLLQQQYNDLQTTYQNYQNTHSYSNLEYNQVVYVNQLMSEQIQALELQYNTYVATHSYTNEQYNTLNNQYQSLQSSYNSLQQQYNDLQDRFNEVIGDSSSAMYFALNGATANLYTEVSGVKTLLASDTISINQNYMNFDNSCIPNINTYLNGYDSEDTTTYPNPYCYIEIDLNMSVSSVLLFTFDNTILDVDITLSSTISDVTNIYKRNSSLNSYQLVVNKDRLSFNKISYDGIYMPDYISIDFSLDIDGYSYSVGYNKGVESQQSRINSLNSSVSSMQSSINALRGINQELQDAANNSMGWKNLFFAMADTPFKTVSNVLGFELFGLNLFTTFIGMITVFAIVWLLKKFI